MAQILEIHPTHPQPRKLAQAVQMLRAGGVLAVPTDSSYALVCHIDDRDAATRLRRLRGLSDKHHLTLLCCDLSQLAHYAVVDNPQFRLMKQATPGAYTFILEATRQVPKRLSHPSRKTIGLRVPDHPVTQALLAAMGEPLLGTTLMLPGEDEPLNDAHEIAQQLGSGPLRIEAVLDAGACALTPSTVLDLTPMSTGAAAQVLRAGSGDLRRVGLSS